MVSWVQNFPVMHFKQAPLQEVGRQNKLYVHRGFNVENEKLKKHSDSLHIAMWTACWEDNSEKHWQDAHRQCANKKALKWILLV